MILTTEAVSGEYLHLNSCGIEHICELDRRQVRPNGRKDYHLLYIASGCCHVMWDGRELTAGEGCLVLFLPGERQEYCFYAADRSISCYLHFSGAGCEELLRQVGLWGHAVYPLGKSRSIEALFEQMLTEYTLKRPFSDGMLGAYLWQFFSLVGRKIAELQYPSGSNRPRIDQVCLLMHEEYAQNQPLTRYAEFCSLSLSRFSHLFKEVTRLTPLQYLNRVRIEKAKELLLNTSLSVAEISESVGFSSQNYFGRLFRQQVGLSPTQFARTQ